MTEIKSIETSTEPFLIEGDIYVDDRGEVAFVNDFDMKTVKRFYTVTNHKPEFIRAWHAHKKEKKFAFVIDGTAVFGAVRVDDWEKPSKDAQVFRFVLSGKKPSILYIPEGYAHGYKTITKRTRLFFFSTATIEQSRADDYRYDAYYWDPWQLVER